MPILLLAFFIGFISTCLLTITAGMLAERLASKDQSKFEALGSPGYLYFLLSAWSVRPRYLFFLLSTEAQQILGRENASLLKTTRTLVLVCSIALVTIVMGGIGA